MVRLLALAILALTACSRSPEPAVAEVGDVGSAAPSLEEKKQAVLDAAQEAFDAQVKARLDRKSTLRGLVRTVSKDARHPLNAARFAESGSKLELVKGKVVFTVTGKSQGVAWEVSSEVSADVELREPQVTRLDESA
jgi:hypothetical protein